jgi:uncharacterized protein with GYD domain
MPKFLFQAYYATEGVRGVMERGGTARRTAIARMLADNGGQLEAFYFAYGKVDAYVFADLPDNETAAAIALAINADPRVTVRTVALLTAEEVDAASGRRINYQPPGT